jgi:predicted RNase H-like nuclease (RuvC/YqgF family)
MTLAETTTASSEVEVSNKARRRRFAAKYKQDILKRADACKEPGALGAMLRSEGLYSSHLAKWRQQRDACELVGLTPKKRGRKTREIDARDRKIAELQKQVERATARADRAEALVDLQKKVASLLGTPFGDDKS